MYKRTIILVATIAILAIFSLIILFSFADKPNSTKNGFNRSLISRNVNMIQTSELTFPIKRLLGATTERFYFTSVNPRIIYSMDYSLSDLDSIYAPFPLNESVLDNYKILGTSPIFILFSGNLSSAISYRIGDSTASIKKLSPPLFTSAVMLSSGNYILKSFDFSKSNQLFEKIDSSSGKVIEQNDLFNKQNDGGFSLDGVLRYNSESQLLIYLQYYQNKMYCLDTNLKVKYIKNTIDTTYTNTVTTETLPIVGDKASLAPKVPLKPIYSDFAVNNRYIYILSRLKADNENQSDFQRNSVIDVYNLSDGVYVFSFYIPSVEEKKARYLYVHNDKLIANYGSTIATFDLAEMLP